MLVAVTYTELTLAKVLILFVADTMPVVTLPPIILPVDNITLPSLTVIFPVAVKEVVVSSVVNLPELGTMLPIMVSCIAPAYKLPPMPTPPATISAPNNLLVLMLAPVMAMVLTDRYVPSDRNRVHAPFVLL